MKLRARRCPLCGGGPGALWQAAHFDADAFSSATFASRKDPEGTHLRLERCNDCDLVYANPAPDPDWIAEAYRDATFDATEESRWAAATYRRLALRGTKDLERLGRALDVGAGDGAFMAELATLGFERVEGVEASEAPAALAPEGLRERIRVEPFDPEDLHAWEKDAYSFVSCLQTIEHLPEPLAFCESAVSLLEPGGMLFLVGHNFRAGSARLLGRRSPIYDVEHLQLFSPRSFRVMLEKAGLERISVSPISNSYPLHYWARLAPIPGKAALRSLLQLPLLRRASLRLRAGNLVAVGFRQGAR